MRLNWVLSLSSYKTSTPLVKNLFGLISVVLEPFRRFIWNFFKIELAHIKVIGNFNAIEKYNFPYKTDMDMSKQEVRTVVDQNVNYYLKKAYGN